MNKIKQENKEEIGSQNFFCHSDQQKFDLNNSLLTFFLHLSFRTLYHTFVITGGIVTHKCWSNCFTISNIGLGYVQENLWCFSYTMNLWTFVTLLAMLDWKRGWTGITGKERCRVSSLLVWNGWNIYHKLVWFCWKWANKEAKVPRKVWIVDIGITAKDTWWR